MAPQPPPPRLLLRRAGLPLGRLRGAAPALARRRGYGGMGVTRHGSPGPAVAGCQAGAPRSTQPYAVLRGRPPLAPFVRAAAAFAGDVTGPAPRTDTRAIHARVPKTPDTSAGTYRSTSNVGQCRLKPIPSTS